MLVARHIQQTAVKIFLITLINLILYSCVANKNKGENNSEIKLYSIGFNKNLLEIYLPSNYSLKYPNIDVSNNIYI